MSSGPRVGLLTVLAALAGLLVAAIAVYLRAAAMGRYTEGEGPALPPGMPDLGLVDLPRRYSPRALAVRTRPDSATAAGYRLLVLKMGLLQQDTSTSAIVVVSAGEGWPAAVVAANVADVLAEAGRSVLIIDAGAERASVTALHRIERSPGYSELVERPQRLDGEIDEFATELAPGLRILPQGQRHVGMLGEETARAMLDRARAAADFVIIAASPMQRSTAALAWGPVADGTVLVGDQARDAEHRIQEAAQALSLVHARVAGAVTARRSGWSLPSLPTGPSAPAGRTGATSAGSAPDEPELASR